MEVISVAAADSARSWKNWSTKWKALTIIASTSVSFTQGFGPLSLAPMFPIYIKEFNSNLTDVVKFTGVAILVLGFSNFIWWVLSSPRWSFKRTDMQRVKGPSQHGLRKTTGLHFLTAHLLRFFYLAGSGNHVWQLHGGLRAEWNWCRPCRDYPASRHCRHFLLARPGLLEHFILGILYGLSHGCTHHFRGHGLSRWMAGMNTSPKFCYIARTDSECL